MTHITSVQPSITICPVPLAEIVPWAVFAAVFFLIAAYFVGAEQGGEGLVARTAGLLLSRDVFCS
ncbi:CbtB-domain containing protein [Rhizobium sp.]|uniref:CbtB-domain containing protein n=1 Tax=Rhizobium sp. TaxID=391 RepID=UPI000E8632A6|nr:cobalt transporter [Rhizobium sp.]